MPYITNYIETRTNNPILEEYDAYIQGLYERGSKPWMMSKAEGVVFINGNSKVHYSWNDIKEDVNRLKILKRTYYKTNFTLDEQIWQSFKCIGIDIWDSDGKDTYGIQTIDDHYLDWNCFKEMVENGQFEETKERSEYMSNFENESPLILESSGKDEIVDSEENWYEPISRTN